jgi:hypothetical protein
MTTLYFVLALVFAILIKPASRVVSLHGIFTIALMKLCAILALVFAGLGIYTALNG